MALVETAASFNDEHKKKRPGWSPACFGNQATMRERNVQERVDERGGHGGMERML